MKPLLIDLYCGLGGWAEGFLAEGYDVIGFDIERHDYGTGGYPGQLVIQDVLTLHGSQFRNAACIVASPPCQEYSYMAMPWSRAKAKAAAIRADESGEALRKLTALFDACFRIQREACEAAGRHIPMVVENVRGAQKWVGDAAWHFGSYYLWGDIPALMPLAKSAKNGTLGGGSWFGLSETNTVLGMNPDGRKIAHAVKHGEGQKVPGISFSGHGEPGYKPQGFNVTATQRFRQEQEGRKLSKEINESIQKGKSPARWTNPAEHYIGKKDGGDWFGSGEDCSLQRKSASKSDSRKAASAQIAKIPFPLAVHIARVYKPCSKGPSDERQGSDREAETLPPGEPLATQR